ncbi:hypothetical protein SAY86_014590 [Trapa natans]|uniref:Uncharacterized protein n=1 Tax=Trapa natans TaxID=22666 RepID=A0AAN7KTL6_TRANT|nr:hypothetical protein SAY86_014590 [Trapa natans]
MHTHTHLAASCSGIGFAGIERTPSKSSEGSNRRCRPQEEREEMSTISRFSHRESERLSMPLMVLFLCEIFDIDINPHLICLVHLLKLYELESLSPFPYVLLLETSCAKDH